MKKLLAYILVFSLLVTYMGLWPVFKIYQNSVRKEIKKRIKEGVPKNELFVFIFDKNHKLKWQEKNKEFWYEGQLYDIVRKTEINGKVVYECISDYQETILFRKLSSLIKEYQKNDKSNLSSIIKFLFKIFSLLFLIEKFFELIKFEVCKTLNDKMIDLKIKDNFIDFLTPPPETCLICSS